MANFALPSRCRWLSRAAGLLLLASSASDAQPLYRLPVQPSSEEQRSQRLDISPSTIQFGPTAVGQKRAARLELTNRNTRDLSLGAIRLTSPEFSVSHGCGKVLPPNGACALDVEFEPSQAGEPFANIEVRGGQGANTWVVPLQGTAAVGVLSISRPSVSFAPTQVLERAAAATARVSNTGTVDLLGLQVEAPPPGSGFIASSACPSVLAPGAECEIGIQFAPTTAVRHEGRIVLTSAAPTAEIRLDGMGVVPAGTLSGASSSVGLGSATSGTLTLSNIGVGMLTLGSLSVQGAGFQHVASTCGAQLAAGAQCAYTVSFTPSYVGAHTGWATLSTNAGTLTASLTGAGIGGAVSSESFSLSFPSTFIGSFAGAQSFTVTNSGSGVLTFGTPYFAGKGNEFPTSSGCGVVQPGSSCVVTVNFKPTGIAGRLAYLYLPHNGGGSGVVTAELWGLGSRP